MSEGRMALSAADKKVVSRFDWFAIALPAVSSAALMLMVGGAIRPTLQWYTAVNALLVGIACGFFGLNHRKLQQVIFKRMQALHARAETSRAKKWMLKGAPVVCLLFVVSQIFLMTTDVDNLDARNLQGLRAVIFFIRPEDYIVSFLQLLMYSALVGWLTARTIMVVRFLWRLDTIE